MPLPIPSPAGADPLPAPPTALFSVSVQLAIYPAPKLNPTAPPNPGDPDVQPPGTTQPDPDAPPAELLQNLRLTSVPSPVSVQMPPPPPPPPYALLRLPLPAPPPIAEFDRKAQFVILTVPLATHIPPP